MKQLAIALIAVLLLALCWWRFAPPEESTAAAPLVGSQPQPMAGSLPGAPAPTAERTVPPAPEAEAATAAPAAAEGAVIVRVLLEPDLEPLEGVEVQLLLGRERILERILTDAQGRARLALPAATVLWSARVSSGARHAALHQWLRNREMAAGEELEIDLRVNAGATLSGRVVDHEGQPIPGATVRAWADGSFQPDRPADAVALADAAGGFELARLPLDFTLDAVAEGWACERGLRGKQLVGEKADGLQVVLRRAAWIEGTVVDSQLRPKAGCGLRVNASGQSSSGDATHVQGITAFYAVKQATLSDERGRFRLGPVPETSWNVRAEHPEHPLIDTGLAPHRPDQVITLPMGSAVTGRVLTHLGQPAVGAQLRVRVGDDISRKAVTDSEGAYRFQGLRHGEGVFAVHARGERLFSRDIEVREGAALKLDVKLEAPLRIAGRVLEADGSPSGGALLHLCGGKVLDMGVIYDEPSTLPWVFSLDKLSADASGSFAFEDLPPGRYTLRVAAADAPREKLEVPVRAGQEAVVVRLDRRAMQKVVLAGRVTAAESGEPLRRFTLTPMIPDSKGGTMHGRAVEIEHADGAFRLAGFEPGAIQLTVRAEGRSTWSSERLELAEGEQRFEVALHVPRTVELEVVDREGKPVPGGTRLRFLSGDRLVSTDLGSFSSTSLKVSKGRAVAQGLPAELLRVQVHLEDAEGPEEMDLDLRSPPSGPVRLVVGVEHPVHIEMLVVCAPKGGAPPAFAGEGLELLQAVFSAVGSGSVAWLDAELSATFRSRGGREGASAKVRPSGPGKWAVSWSAKYSSGEVSNSYSHLMCEAPGSMVEVELTAPGYQTQTLAVDPRRPNGGLPAVLVLRR